MARMVGVKRYGDKFHGDILVLENDHIQKTALSLEISQECLIVGAKLLSLRRKESCKLRQCSTDKKDVIYIRVSLVIDEMVRCQQGLF